MASKKTRRRNMLIGKGSSTPGISKGDNCKKTPLKVEFTKDSKMIKKKPKLYLQALNIARSYN